MKDHELLRAALAGYRMEYARIGGEIDKLERQLGPRNNNVLPMPARKKRHKISPEGRARIAAAQKRRWAAKKRANG